MDWGERDDPEECAHREGGDRGRRSGRDKKCWRGGSGGRGAGTPIQEKAGTIKIAKNTLILWNAGALSLGGATNLAKSVLSSLDRGQIDIVGISVHSIPKEISEQFKKEKIPILSRKSPLKLLFKLFDALLCYKKVLIYSLGAGDLPFLLKKLIPRSVYIYHEISLVPQGESKAKKCLFNADLVIVNSKHAKDDLSRRFVQQAKKFVLIPTLAPIHPPLKTPVESRKKTRLTFAYAGRFSEGKRIKELIKDWPNISQKCGQPPPCLHVFSDAKDDEIRTFITDPIYRNVKIYPPFPNQSFSQVMEEVDCLLLPSLWEGQPMSLVEASLIGIPFVVCEGNGCDDFKESNPDVIVCSKEWGKFTEAVVLMNKKILSHQISSHRLSGWAAARFNPISVSERYRKFFEGFGAKET